MRLQTWDTRRIFSFCHHRTKYFPPVKGRNRLSWEIMVYARTAHVRQKLVFHFTSVYSVYGLFFPFLFGCFFVLDSKSDIQLHKIVLQSALKIISHPPLTANPQEWVNAHTHKRKTLRTLISSTYFQYIFLYRWLQLVFLLLSLFSGCWAINTVSGEQHQKTLLGKLQSYCTWGTHPPREGPMCTGNLK